MIESNAHGSSTNRFPAVPEEAAKVEMVPRKPDNWRAAAASPSLQYGSADAPAKVVWRTAKPFPTFPHHALTFRTHPTTAATAARDRPRGIHMPTVTWDHIHLRSPDPEATAAWLADILGAEIVRGPGRIDVRLGGANVFIAPVTPGDGVNIPPTTPYQGLDHFGLTVKDIDAVAAEIKAKGVEFTKEPTTIRPGVRICFIRGPQGISIELLERDKKYA
jgi:catechol 2,3-dioxygenase-like lactoylglutathione lyase family enzyme